MTQESFKIIFNNYFDTVRNYIYYRCGNEELATDIAQEAFMKIWEKQLIKDENKAIGLLYKIANNIFASNYRRKQVEIKFRNTLGSPETDFSPEDNFQYNELKERYENAISKLSEKQRIVFLMSRNDELKYHEIAERLNISVKAIEKRMSKAIAQLKKEMAEFY